jgi:DNA-binding transcriptional ArsR family regulator
MDRKLLWWIFGVTKGGIIRAKIVKLLDERPANANQLAKTLKMDYTTVRYHLDVLLKHSIVETSGHTYIVMYFPSDNMMDHWDEFLKIYEKIVGGNET